MENFDDIRPLNNDEAPALFQKLKGEKRFIDVVLKYLPKYSIKELEKEFDHFRDIYDFQITFIKRFIDLFVSQTTTSLDFKGIEKTNKDKAYLYIANHRDITFDAAMLQYYCFIKHLNTTKIAMGDNLITTPVLGDVARLNKMFIVKRSEPIRERLENFKHLSAYIQHCLFVEKESVWIAQRDGRTKDGHDYTKQGLIKMVSMSNEKNVLDTIRKLNITPLTISYEYEPCDSLKARELALSENGRHYQKRPEEDFESIKKGIFDPKGHVSLVIGTPLDQVLDGIPDNISNNDKLTQVCRLIDKQIYKDYKLYATNYIANDVMNACDRYHEFYTEEEKTHFMEYLHRKSIVQDVSKDKMMHYLLRIYGTPVDNHYESVKKEEK